MSASLVGSEMCIRDSGSPGHAAIRWASSLRSAASWTWRKSSSSPSATVSYTHLTLPTICSV
eukprot:8946766-Alexandrium_andersonii.AAC.1